MAVIACGLGFTVRLGAVRFCFASTPFLSGVVAVMAIGGWATGGLIEAALAGMTAIFFLGTLVIASICV